MKTQKKLWTMPLWMEQYRPLINNTGGNSVEGLMNDEDTNSFNNFIRYELICCVASQVNLLEVLHEKGLLK